MKKTKKKDDVSKYAIPGGLLIGIGIGFLLMPTFPLAIPAFTLIGLGVGFLITLGMSIKK
ncbi:MAG: hypothetical protein GOV02_00770 [Candidatus Aenigmarchaeota archaeon]|nr:hypothetical protein [Candidatus Aenigmarchaeota archaeon]